MNTKPKSFRLSDEAVTELTRLAREWQISESKVVEILLTDKSLVESRDDKTSAARSLRMYMTSLFGKLINV